MSNVGEEELSVGSIGRCRGRREVGLLSFLALVEGRNFGVRVRFLIGRDEVVSRGVEPSHAEVRSDGRTVSDDVVVLDVVPVTERTEIIRVEDLGRTEC